MSQIHKFYLTEFLKTQRYYIPIIILFLQFHKLNYTEIFLLYAIESAAVFLLEVPSGVVADQFGKKNSLIFARAILIPAYVIFAIADNFWLFLPAMLLMAVNKAFKSGTNKAFIYDYLAQQRPDVAHSEVFGKSKFWARMGEAAASAGGGFIAVKWGYNAVFLVAILPAVVNLINVLTYSKIKEEHKIDSISFAAHFSHTGRALQEIIKKKIVTRLILNSSLLVFCIEAAEKFFQPYMLQTQIPIEWFGPIYAAIFILTAFGSRYAYLLEKRFSRPGIINSSGWLVLIPLIVIGFRFISPAGIGLFFLVLFIKNIRRPAMITELNNHISQKNRATILSVDSLFRALFQLLLLPVIGYISDTYSIYIAVLVLCFFMAATQIWVAIPGPGRRQ